MKNLTSGEKCEKLNIWGKNVKNFTFGETCKNFTSGEKCEKLNIWGKNVKNLTSGKKM